PAAARSRRRSAKSIGLPGPDQLLGRMSPAPFRMLLEQRHDPRGCRNKPITLARRRLNVQRLALYQYLNFRKRQIAKHALVSAVTFLESKLIVHVPKQIGLLREKF